MESNIYEVTFLVFLIGMLVGVIFNEKKHRWFILACVTITILIIIELSKDITIPSYNINYIYFSFLYLGVFLFGTVIGILLDIFSKRKAKNLVRSKR